MNNPYGNYLQHQDALAVLNAMPLRMEALGAQIFPAKVAIPFAEGKWNAAQILLHLAQCDLNFGTRYRQAVTLENFVVQPFDQDAWMDREPEMDFQTALATFLAIRNFNLNWLNNLRAADLRKTFTHPELGAGLVQELLEIAAGHDLNHLAQLEIIAAR